MLPQGSAREHFTEALRVEVVTLQAQHPILADALESREMLGEINKIK